MLLSEFAYKIGSDELAFVSALVKDQSLSSRYRQISRRSFGKRGAINISIIEQLEVNGVAASGKNNEFDAALYLGFVFSVAELVSAIWQNNSFMPWIGTVSRHQSPTERFSDQISGLEFIETISEKTQSNDYNELMNYIRTVSFTAIIENIICSTRRGHANLMVAELIRVGWLHELGHIVLDHTSVDPIFEFLPSILNKAQKTADLAVHDLNDKDRQMAELMADEFAGRIVLERAFDYDERAPLNFEDTIVVTMIATAMLCILYHAVHVLIEADQSSSHPPVWVRIQRLLDLSSSIWKSHQISHLHQSQFSSIEKNILVLCIR